MEKNRKKILSRNYLLGTTKYEIFIKKLFYNFLQDIFLLTSFFLNS